MTQDLKGNGQSEEQAIQIQYRLTTAQQMKNYSHLYPTTNTKKPTGKPTRSPKKNSTLTSITFTSKASMKTLAPYCNTLNRDKKISMRSFARSIEEHHARSVENEDTLVSRLQNDDEELFDQSYCKIGKIKQTFPYKNIDHELNEVLALIREEKSLIGEKMKALKRSNDNYRQICEGYRLKGFDCAVNTEAFIEGGREIVSIDQGVECNLDKELEEGKVEEEEKVESIEGKECYLKLGKMLQEMGINPADILPKDEKIHEEILISDYKCLSDKQTIKIQKFFIRKLIDKLSR